jgi:hypothetical protein
VGDRRRGASAAETRRRLDSTAARHRDHRHGSEECLAHHVSIVAPRTSTFQLTSSFGYLAPASFVLGDLDGDGRTDIALANPDTYDVTAARGAGDGAFLPRVSYGLSASPISVALGDINGDGSLDLAVGTDLTESQQSSSRAFVLLGNGDGTFDAPVAFDVGAGPATVALGDLDGDGLPELVVANAGSGTVSVLSFIPCGGTPGTPDQTACVNGAPCTGTVTLLCAGGPGSDSCTQSCDCSGSGIYCNLGCP